VPKYFTPPDKTMVQRSISPFNNMTPNMKYSYTTPQLFNSRDNINMDPQEKCVVEGCLGRRMITPNGEKLLVCSMECERKLRGVFNQFI